MRRRKKRAFPARSVIKQLQWSREYAVRQFVAGQIGREEARAIVARCNREIARIGGAA